MSDVERLAEESAKAIKALSDKETEVFNIIIDYFNRMVQELSGMETLRTDFIRRPR